MHLIQTIENTLSDLKGCLIQLDSTFYTRQLPIFSGSSTGQHTRHIIEFFQCLLVQSETGVINYDKRLRNLAIEADTGMAIRCIDEVVAELRPHTDNEELVLEVTYSLDEDHVQRVATNFERELIYNIEHAIHHMAIIKMGLMAEGAMVELPEEFGVAPSTIRYKQLTT